jgi:hypothetical protein
MSQLDFVSEPIERVENAQEVKRNMNSYELINIASTVGRRTWPKSKNNLTM